jgi:hypothetical protein
MERILKGSIEIRQTIIGKVMMALHVPALLGRLGIIDFEGAKVLMLKTFKARIGSGKWKRLGGEYYISINR